jgi:catechol 2,3-dioxygenase-like lactoylglutathione lyase family enzyme
MSTIKGLAHIGIKTADMEQSITFYTSLLNFKLTHRQFVGTTELAFLQVGDCIVELIAPADPTGINDLKPGQIDHFTLLVDDLAAEAARLEAAGVQFFAPPRQSPIFANGIRCVFFPGPSGERIELFQIL